MTPLLRLLPQLQVKVARLTPTSARFVLYTNPASWHTNLTLRVRGSVNRHLTPALPQALHAVYTVQFSAFTKFVSSEMRKEKTLDLDIGQGIIVVFGCGDAGCC
jgi:hypothetical protein